MALPQAITAAPVLQGWLTSRRDDGTYEATRAEPLTAYQRAHGCLLVVHADSVPELDWLCHAQRDYALGIARAEQAADEANQP